jgi:acylphosphatase
MSNEQLAVRWFISGRVQGVGFRWFVSRRAEELGVVGCARNLSDVELRFMARGPGRTWILSIVR